MKTKVVLIGMVIILITSGVILFREKVGYFFDKSAPVSGELGDKARVKDEGNVHMVDGKQIIEIKVKGGYKPKKSLAKAGIPTILRFETNGTFDCSSAVTIPNMKINKNLPSVGSTDIEIGAPSAGTLNGTCSMGMYSFQVVFE